MGSPSSTSHQVTTASENSPDIFHPFLRLPPELRRKIWTHYLVNATPQIYTFELKYDYRILYYRSRKHKRKGDQLFLQPHGWEGGTGDNVNYFHQPLRASMATRHIASATCVESRQVVLEIYPDTLRFRQFPLLAWMRDPPKNGPDHGGFPEYVLRLNYAKDIIIFHASWEDQEAAIKIAKFKGSPPADFFKIRHVGISFGSLTVVYHNHHRFGQRGEFRLHGGHCGCETEVCLDCCKEEPLPKFLSLFPSLEKFYIAGVPDGVYHPPEDKLQAGNGPSGEANCPCPTSGPRHSWPMINAWDACGWFAIYDERSACPFPKSDRIEKIRKNWRPHFPYYRALEHLQIRFIQLWDPETLSNSPQCSHCHYDKGIQYQ